MTLISSRRVLAAAAAAAMLALPLNLPVGAQRRAAPPKATAPAETFMAVYPAPTDIASATAPAAG